MQDAGEQESASSQKLGEGQAAGLIPFGMNCLQLLQLGVHTSGVAADTPTNANWAAGYRSCTATHLDSCILKGLISSVEHGRLPISWPILFR